MRVIGRPTARAEDRTEDIVREAAARGALSGVLFALLMLIWASPASAIVGGVLFALWMGGFFAAYLLALRVRARQRQ